MMGYRLVGRRCRFLAATVMVVVLASMLTVIQQAPASAGARNCDDGSGQVCLYKNSSYANGGIRRYSGSVSNYAGITYLHCWLNCGSDNSISSIKNRGNYMNTRHYSGKNYTGASIRIRRGHQHDFYGEYLNNKLSSQKWVW